METKIFYNKLLISLKAVIFFVIMLSIIVCTHVKAENCNGLIKTFYVGPNPDTEYIEICEIIFDMNDIVDEFDLIGCPQGVTTLNGYDVGELDKNQDGISDWIFSERRGNLLIWKPKNGCVKITQQGHGDNQFNPNLGYAMVCVKGKPGLTEGSGIIPAKIISTLLSGKEQIDEKALTVSYSDCKSPIDSNMQQERRVALVIGNNSYRETPLHNPINDAQDIAKVLRGCDSRVSVEPI